MKAQIIESGEIVRIVSKDVQYGMVAVIHDNKTFSNETVTNLKLIDDWEDNKIDWEKERINIASMCLAHYYASITNQISIDAIKCVSKEVVDLADGLVEELKKRNNHGSVSQS